MHLLSFPNRVLILQMFLDFCLLHLLGPFRTFPSECTCLPGQLRKFSALVHRDAMLPFLKIIEGGSWLEVPDLFGSRSNEAVYTGGPSLPCCALAWAGRAPTAGSPSALPHLARVGPSSPQPFPKEAQSFLVSRSDPVPILPS